MQISYNSDSSFPDQVVPDAEKATEEYGLAVGRAIEGEWFRNYRYGTNSPGYAVNFNNYNLLRLYARGEQPVQKYKDELAINGDLSYLNLDWKPVPVVSKFVDIVVNGISQRSYDINAYAQELFNYNYDGQNRSYYLFVPDSIQTGAPLVFVLHGYTGSAAGIMNYSGMNNIAENEKFVVCYPQGTLDGSGNAFWNVGYDFHSDQTVDDVGFIIELAQFLQTENNLSRNNTFSTGMSNGGELSYLLACQASDIFCSVAPVSGTMMSWFFDTCEPLEPISVFEIHGTDDNVSSYSGDYDNSEGWGVYMDIDTIIELWSGLNECNLLVIDTLENINTSDGSYIITEKYQNCIYDNQVWLYKVVNGGHDWPGAYGNMDINASAEVWQFFSQNMNIENIGDVNFDQVINIQDLLKISDQSLNNSSYYYLFDFNEDDEININDIFSIAAHMLGF